MGNEINIKIGAVQNVSDELDDVNKSAQQTGKILLTTMGSSEEAFDSAARASGRLGEKLDLLSGASSQLSGGVGDIGGAMTAFTDLTNLAATRALEHRQALLDVEAAQRAYDEAVAEFGANSLEARQAQLELNAAQEAAKPPTAIAEWGERLELISPILTGITGALDLMILANNAATISFVRQAAAQIASKTAMVAGAVATGVATAANWLLAGSTWAALGPILLIIAAVALLAAGIIWVATKTTFFQDVWRVAWTFIKDVAAAAWETIRNVVKRGIDFIVAYFKFIFSLPGKVAEVFKHVAEFITAPFRAAFNAIAKLWNNTVGKLSFSVPDWVPGIGGKGFSMPKLPQMARGGFVEQTGVAVVHQGETVVPASGPRGGHLPVARLEGPLVDWIMSALRKEISIEGGDVQVVLGVSRS